MGRPKLITDDDILAQAFPVISKEGFESFTLEQVSEVTGLAPATLIRRFKTKKQLAFLSRNWKWNQILNYTDSNLSLNEGLDGIFHLVKEIAKSLEHTRMSEHLKLLAEDIEHPLLKETASTYFQWTRDILKKFILQSVEKKELNNKINAEELSFHIEALIQGTIFQFSFLKDKCIETQLITQINYALKPYIINNKKNS